MKVHPQAPPVNPGGGPSPFRAEPRRGAKLPYRFNAVPADLKRIPGLQPVDHVVLEIVLEFTTIYRDSAWCAMPTIAQRLAGRSGRPAACVRTVQRSIKRLKAAGIIDHVKVSPPGKVDPDEPRNRTGYRFHFLFMAEGWTPGGGAPEVVTSKSPPPVTSKSPPPVTSKSPKKDVVVQREGTEIDPPKPPRGGRGTEFPQLRQRQRLTASTAAEPAPAGPSAPVPAPDGSSSRGSLPSSGPEPGMERRSGPGDGLAAFRAGLVAGATMPPPGGRPAIGGPDWMARLRAARPAAPAAAVAAPMSTQPAPVASPPRGLMPRGRIEARAAETDDPILLGELEHLRLAGEAAAQREAAAIANEPRDLAELLPRIRERPWYPLEAAGLLARSFDDHKSQAYYGLVCKEAFEGALDPADLADAYRQATSEKAREPGKVFTAAIQRHRPRAR